MICRTGLNKLSHHVLKLFSEEYGNDRRGCLIRAQSVFVAYICGTLSEKIGMIVKQLGARKKKK